MKPWLADLRQGVVLTSMDTFAEAQLSVQGDISVQGKCPPLLNRSFDLCLWAGLWGAVPSICRSMQLSA